MGLCEFIFLGVCWAFWMFIFMSFMKFGKSSSITSNIFSALPSPSVTPTMCMLVYWMVSHRSLTLCLLFFNLFCFSDSKFSIVLSSSSLIPYSACSILPLNLSSETVILCFISYISFWFGVKNCFFDYLLKICTMA